MHSRGMFPEHFLICHVELDYNHEAAHVVLQTMSSESTPVLCGAIASFELLMTKWERLGEEHPELQYWSRIGLHWARKYYKRMDDTDAYIITMSRFLFSRSPGH